MCWFEFMNYAQSLNVYIIITSTIFVHKIFKDFILIFVWFTGFFIVRIYNFHVLSDHMQQFKGLIALKNWTW